MGRLAGVGRQCAPVVPPRDSVEVRPPRRTADAGPSASLDHLRGPQPLSISVRGPRTRSSSEATHTPDEWQITRWQSALVALGTLAVVFGLAFSVMIGGGEIVRAVNPSKRINLFAAFHNWWVVGALLGITALWLLPPHPWAKRALASLPREHLATSAGGVERSERSDPAPSVIHVETAATI
jgi:hypothetical protein